MKFPRFKEYVDFVTERHAIYTRRQAGQPKPWTKDTVLQSYRFTNMYRELDTVTIWLREHWLEPHWDEQDLWFVCVVFRLVNWPESLEEAGFPLPWRPERWSRVMDARRERGDKVFTGAFMIRGNELPDLGRSKAAYEAARIFTPIWERRKEARKVFCPGTTLADAHAWLKTNYGIGGDFLAAQVIADVKHTPLLGEAPDWWEFAAMGPGSKRGLNKLLGRDKRSKWKADEWLSTLQELRTKLNAVVTKKGMPPFCAQDVQGTLCEVDKYWRVQSGEGRPRSKYPGQGE